MGEPHKALDLFVDASVGLRNEQRGRNESFLSTIILATTEESSESRRLVTYLLKVWYSILAFISCYLEFSSYSKILLKRNLWIARK